MVDREHLLCWLALLAFLVAGFVAGSASALESPLQTPLVPPAADCPALPEPFRSNRKYDSMFRQAAARHWPAPMRDNWCWLKAQAAAESGLDPKATSPVGAKGLTQFMDPTLADVERKLGRDLDPFVARDSIEAQAVYTRNLRRQLTDARPNELEAHRIVWAMYNAGGGHIWCAQRHADGAVLWPPIASQLHLCTGRHAEETRGYVARISRYVGAPLTNPIPRFPIPSQRPIACPIPLAMDAYETDDRTEWDWFDWPYIWEAVFA